MSSPHTTGVWMTAESATVLRWSPELTVPHLIPSTVPGRHRSTGRPPTEEHPGGEVVEHFANHVRTDDDKHGRERRIRVEKSGPITERQLLARIRTFAGSPAKRYLPR